jgi:diguanylate cyclase (GGDEF)-like protein/putative nucleotidyltransferase with HDIG domain
MFEDRANATKDRQRHAALHGRNGWQFAFLAAVVTLGWMFVVRELAHWHSDNLLRFAGLLAGALFASRLMIPIPNSKASLSPGFIIQFLACLELSLSESISICVISILTQGLAGKKPRLKQIAFNCATTAISTYLYTQGFGWLVSVPWIGLAAGLLVGATLYHVGGTVGVARMITFENGEPLVPFWRRNYGWLLPYYLAGSCIAGLIDAVEGHLGGQYLVVLLPVVYLIYRSYLTYLGRIEDSRRHSEEVAALHLRTIESLALAIEAKDDTTHAHLRRVQTYALAIGEDLGMRGDQLEALRAAAILHDIGKLAVPEHIICKPGKLTPEEFEKMKIHPVVGAEILEHVKFPYPVAPIVLAHHEKWNGMGYPYGLKGEEIPLGARILAAVDCLDALASDRQYRRALPLDEAMKVVEGDVSRSFDPAVVEVLKRRYVELEKLAQVSCAETVKLSKDIKIERGEAPAAGFESSAAASLPSSPSANRAEPVEFLSAIASARREVQELFEMSQELGSSLSLAETLSLVGSRLKRLIPHETMALWVQKVDILQAEYVQGENAPLFQSLRIPVGEGLAGWVAQHGRPIMNGNPAVEPGYLNDPTKITNLRSAIAIPLSGVNGFVGVLALYQSDKDGFLKDHLRVLQAIGAKLAISIENSRRFQDAEASTSTDGLTGLLNVKSMFVRFDAELARSKRSGDPLTVLVCDVNGFKAFNERLGQLAGNRVLRALAAGLREVFREYDLVARLGGDEFVVILPGMAAEATDVRIRQIDELLALEGEREGAVDSLTVSTGVASYPRDGETVEDLLSEADRRMYQTKRKRQLMRIVPAATVETRAPAPLVPAVVPAGLELVPPAGRGRTSLSNSIRSPQPG